MNQPWTAIASFVVSTFALLIAGFSLWISWRRDRREILANEPTAFAEVRLLPEHENWYEVVVTIENRSDVNIRLKQIEIIRPFRARGFRKWDVMVRTPTGNSAVPEVLDRDTASRKLSYNTRIRPAGSNASFAGMVKMGAGDTHSETLFVFGRPSRVFNTVAMRLTLSSDTAIERLKSIEIIRTLPQAAKTANA